MNSSAYIPNLERGARVRLIGNHSKKGERCTIVEALPNPSHLAKNQWYDVRFDDFFLGRFIERDLEPVAADQRKTVA
jgi:hypothetical protein